MSDNEKRVKRLIKDYGKGTDGSSPTLKQWHMLLALPASEPVSLINLFKMRERAKYPRGSSAAPCSGEEAFQRYASVSGGALEQVGGQFLLVSPFKGGFVGAVGRLGSYRDRHLSQHRQSAVAIRKHRIPTSLYSPDSRMCPPNCRYGLTDDRYFA